MRVERRGRVIRACLAVNRACAGGAGERVEAGGQVVCGFQAAGLGGVAGGEGQRGGCGCRRGVDPGVRGEPCGEPLRALESALRGVLHAAAGEGGRDSEEGRGFACSGCPRSLTGLPRRLCTCTWSRRWSLSFTRTPTGTGRDGPLMTLSGAADRGVGDTTGFSIWISGRSSTRSITRSFWRRSLTTPTCGGSFSMSSG